MPEPLTGLGALAPSRRRAYADAVAHGQAAYERAIAAHAQAERDRKEELAQAQSDHELSVGREREQVRQQHAMVDQMAHDFAEGKRKAVADYFSGVLAVQRYPWRHRVEHSSANHRQRVLATVPRSGFGTRH